MGCIYILHDTGVKLKLNLFASPRADPGFATWVPGNRYAVLQTIADRVAKPAAGFRLFPWQHSRAQRSVACIANTNLIRTLLDNIYEYKN